MTEQIISGKELLDNFFNEVLQIQGVDADVASSIVSLYQSGKLSNVNITNELQRLRETTLNDKIK